MRNQLYNFPDCAKHIATWVTVMTLIAIRQLARYTLCTFICQDEELTMEKFTLTN